MPEQYYKTITDILVKVEGLSIKLDAIANLNHEIKQVSHKVSEINDITVQHTKDLESANRRIGTIEDNNKWLWRTVAGFVVVTVGAAIITAIKLGG
ncbi:hemolysin XhlA family protein [Paenibacillus glycanilyticus]|uniref:hemolysin XhlA family protein n=1 Tax=Paenibacillus glycanilyticus TaxID=126569 RepID=UPI00204218AA|nr:hemolysin XhlA family protein [Paenibacillus glycanilyticus]MCM3628810.1 hemolysin XhlA family protein [Paenibacillus glycanilyticus]